MRPGTSILVFTVLVVVAAAGPAGDDPADKALKKLEGTYTLVAGEQDGKTLSEEVLKNSRLTLKGNEHVVLVGEVVIKGTHKLNPAKKPHEIDATDVEGPYKGHTVHGIYKAKGNEFVVCFAPPGKDRPTEFTTKSGTGHVYHTWRKTAGK